MKRTLKLKTLAAISIIIITALLSNSLSIMAVSNETYNFSDFSEADSIAFVEDHNIEIPAKLANSEDLESFTLSLILQSYDNPNVPFCFNYDKTQKYAEDIRMAVRSYIEIGNVPAVASTSTYTLQQNTVQDSQGNWVTSGGYYNPKWQNYNCYAYSINRAEQPQFYDSGEYIQYQPGDMFGRGNFDTCENIDDLARIVKDDLTAMGYTGIITSYDIPTIDANKNLICVRMNENGVDYHFMRYDTSTDYWYHKPGATAVLKYNYIPTNDRIWGSENSYNGVESAGSPNYYYDSDIVFITYNKNIIDLSSDNVIIKNVIKDKDIFYEFDVECAGNYSLNMNSSYVLEYNIYDEDFDIISSGTGSDIYAQLHLPIGKYYLRVNSHADSVSDSVAINLKHIHNDYNYIWLSNTIHRSICGCGYSMSSAHIVQAGSFVGQYAKCLLCGGRATVGGVTIGSTSEWYHTDNGSYIMPNGIIVLVDKDIEAYFSGNLHFYIDEDENVLY